MWQVGARFRLISLTLTFERPADGYEDEKKLKTQTHTHTHDSKAHEWTVRVGRAAHLAPVRRVRVCRPGSMHTGGGGCLDQHGELVVAPQRRQLSCTTGAGQRDQIGQKSQDKWIFGYLLPSSRPPGPRAKANQPSLSEKKIGQHFSHSSNSVAQTNLSHYREKPYRLVRFICSCACLSWMS